MTDTTINSDWFQGAFDTSAIGMAFVSPKGEWLRVNDALLRMLGYTESELLALTFQDITHPDDLKADVDQVQQMLEGTITTYQMQKRYFHKDKHIVYVLLSVSLVRHEDGSPHFFVSQIVDITSEKISEQNLQHVEQRQQRILSSMVNGLYIYNVAQSSNEYINNQYTAITGWTLQEINDMGEDFMNLFHPDDAERVTKHIVELLSSKTEEPHQIEYRFKQKNGDYIWLLSFDTPFELAEDGSVTKFIGSFIDISVRKQLETEQKETIEDLTEVNKLTVGRELRMVELKNEVNALLQELGREKRY